ATHPFGAQFNYMEDQPRNWREAFCVLTFFKGRLLQPELVLAFDDNHVEFRGEVIMIDGEGSAVAGSGRGLPGDMQEALDGEEIAYEGEPRRRWRRSKERPKKERRRARRQP